MASLFTHSAHVKLPALNASRIPGMRRCGCPACCRRRVLPPAVLHCQHARRNVRHFPSFTSTARIFCFQPATSAVHSRFVPRSNFTQGVPNSSDRPSSTLIRHDMQFVRDRCPLRFPGRSVRVLSPPPQMAPTDHLHLGAVFSRGASLAHTARLAAAPPPHPLSRRGTCK